MPNINMPTMPDDETINWGNTIIAAFQEVCGAINNLPAANHAHSQYLPAGALSDLSEQVSNLQSAVQEMNDLINQTINTDLTDVVVEASISNSNGTLNIEMWTNITLDNAIWSVGIKRNNITVWGASNVPTSLSIAGNNLFPANSNLEITIKVRVGIHTVTQTFNHTYQVTVPEIITELQTKIDGVNSDLTNVLTIGNLVDALKDDAEFVGIIATAVR
jgi:hypothetical protein